MRTSLDHLSRHRITEGPLATPQWAKYGTFLFHRESTLWYLNVSDSRDPGAAGWEHAAIVGLKDLSKLRMVPDIWVIADLKEKVWTEDETVAIYFNRGLGNEFHAHLWLPPAGASMSARPEKEWATSIIRRWEAINLGQLLGRTEQLEIA